MSPPAADQETRPGPAAGPGCPGCAGHIGAHDPAIRGLAFNEALITGQSPGERMRLYIGQFHDAGHDVTRMDPAGGVAQ